MVNEKDRAYNQSERGKARYKRYKSSAKGLEVGRKADERYRRSTRGIIVNMKKGLRYSMAAKTEKLAQLEHELQLLKEGINV